MVACRATFYAPNSGWSYLYSARFISFISYSPLSIKNLMIRSKYPLFESAYPALFNRSSVSSRFSSRAMASATAVGLEGL